MVYYLEYAHALKFLIDKKLSIMRGHIEVEANEIHRKNEEMRQKEKSMNEIMHLFYTRLL